MNDAFPTLLGGFLNSLTVRTEPWVSNWLTPIWILGLGTLVGVLAVLVLWLLGFGLSRIAPLSKMSECRNTRRIAGIVLGLVLLGIASPWLVAELRQHWAALAEKDLPTSPISDSLWAFLPALFAALVTGWALIVLVSRRTMEELPLLFQEGPLFWISVAVCSFALFGLVGVVLVRDPEAMLESLQRWPSLAPQELTFEVKGQAGAEFERGAEQRFDVSWRRKELRQIIFTSNESLLISGYASEQNAPIQPLQISGGEPTRWLANSDPTGPFGDLQDIDSLYVVNFGDQDATLKVNVLSGPATPEMLTVPIVACGVLALFLMFLAIWGLLPKLAAIAFATAKSEMNTPLFMLLTAAGAFALFVFVWLPYNTFGEDIKMLKFTALNTMLVVAMIQAIWSASTSVADEVEGRTALTVLSKPVGRRDFILGKFLGIAWLALVMFTVFSAVTLLCVAYKPIFDVKEGGKMPERPNVADPLGLVDPVREAGLREDEVTWQICHSEMASTIPAIALVYAQTVVMAAVSVAISTRLALVANFTICLAVYALGHLTPLLVQSNAVAERFEAVIFMGQLIAAVLPVLEYFDVEAAIAKGSAISLVYVGATFIYTALYCTIAMLLALVLFEDRDLA